MSKATEYETIWKVLSKVDVGEHTKTIGGGKFKLSYLSWAWAWGVVMEHFPHSEYSFTEFDNGSDVRYYSDGTCAVECTITIGALSRSMWLPVMDNRHKAVSSPNALQISNAKMRCLTKCLAMWGLGHYIYAGEDLPSDYADNKEEPLPDDEEERAAIIEHDGGETKAVAETKARAETKNGQPKTLSQWRESFLDHPENVVSKSDAGVVVANQSSVEGWQTANKAFEVFMPTIQDYPDSDECVNKLKVFWKSNKKTLERMSKEQPEAHEQVMSKFKAAKEAAIAGKMPAFPQ